jgi:hypothetical protein
MFHFSLRFLVGKVLESKDGCPMINVGDAAGKSRQKNCAYLWLLHLGTDPSPWVQDDTWERFLPQAAAMRRRKSRWIPADYLRG